MSAWGKIFGLASPTRAVAAAAVPSACYFGVQYQRTSWDEDGKQKMFFKPFQPALCEKPPAAFEHDVKRRATMSSASKNVLEAGLISCNNARSFPLERSKTALVIIDMQNDFLSPDGRVGQHYATTTPVRTGIPYVERLLHACREAGMVVAHSRSHRYGAKVRDDLVGTGDKGYEIIDELTPLPGEIVVDKWTFGAFASTPLEEELRARGIDRIILCGVLTNVCIFATASQAVDRFFRVCLVEDACAAFNQEWHDCAIRLIGEPQAKAGHNAQTGLYFGEVTQTDKVEEALKPFATLPKTN
eukprot:TRINITY_DN9016_c0_g2_i1.p1 TRINITY_DN9016_c0_g2~~TRINITY_DN9016_c0_g2_i1.p1  ORF type:complete len:301 (+),score=60.60 TRINITY_DN9016_c0_g2_i1:93-995(+)